ncbi:hypothetical protein BDV24DRAFT_125874 [Aspergillus arachidicola]|uniref:Uncharacterized protein n=1 Tax=Aspergillus arachidicola TaxID=656916 RepID=A0A5N6YIT0_9EURO|nr:hypothetical protein BDV24DRAFT_125874 [Aspergillus arachidicola]
MLLSKRLILVSLVCCSLLVHILKYYVEQMLGKPRTLRLSVHVVFIYEDYSNYHDYVELQVVNSALGSCSAAVLVLYC